MQGNFRIKGSLQPLKGDFFNSSVYSKFMQQETFHRWSTAPGPVLMQSEQDQLQKLGLIYSSWASFNADWARSAPGAGLNILISGLASAGFIYFSAELGLLQPQRQQLLAALLSPADTSAVMWNHHQMPQTVTWACPLFFPGSCPEAISPWWKGGGLGSDLSCMLTEGT